MLYRFLSEEYQGMGSPESNRVRALFGTVLGMPRPRMRSNSWSVRSRRHADCDDIHRMGPWHHVLFAIDALLSFERLWQRKPSALVRHETSSQDWPCS